MKKKHGLTITLASLSAATASIVTGAFVSQSATASSDVPAEASVTIVTAVDGGQPVRCTFDDVTLPGAAAVSVSADQDAPHFAITGGAGIETAAAGAAGAVRVMGEATIATGVPDGATIHVFTPEEVREGTPEECAAMRASMPDGLPMPVLPAGADGAPTEVARITGIIGGTGSGSPTRPN